MAVDLSGVVEVLRAISDSMPYRGALVFYGARTRCSARSRCTPS